MKILQKSSRRRHSDQTGANYDPNIHEQQSSSVNYSNYHRYGYLFVIRTLLRRLFRASTRRKSIICLFTLFGLFCTTYLLYNYVNTKMGVNIDISSTDSSSSFIEPAPVMAKEHSTNADHRDEDFFSIYEPEKHLTDSMNRRIEELNRIRVSILTELRTLEEKRNNLRTEIDGLMVQSERMQSELRQGVKELEHIRMAIEQEKILKKEMAEKNTPEIALPAPLLPRSLPDSEQNDLESSPSKCTMSACFDYSRCSITNGFPIYIYGIDQIAPEIFDQELIRVFSSSPYVVQDPNRACVFLVLLKSGVSLTTELIKTCLPYWHRTGDGANHILIHGNPFKFIGRSLLITDEIIRPNFDIISPKFSLDLPADINGERTFLELPSIVPARRHYFLSVLNCSHSRKGEGNWNFLRTEFQRIRSSKTDDLIYFHSSCLPDSTPEPAPMDSVLDRSTFALLVFSESNADADFIERFVDALQRGSIPVVLSSSKLPFSNFLPLGETLDWRLASVQLPLQRLPELHFYLRTLTDSDILDLRQHGQLFYRTYFSSRTRLMESVLAVLRQRLNLPAAPMRESELRSFFNDTYQPKFGDFTTKATEVLSLNEVDEYLGPVETPYPSPSYEQNFTSTSMFSYELWNVYADPFRLYPQLPFTKQPLPSEAKYLGSPFGYRPINNGAGGSGKEFSESLGGNYPREQFTVVLLTYEREQVLMAALSRLNNLPYLNKIIVVWNGPTPPNPDTVWPKLTSPLVVLKPEKNSLNNRFLPFREIETEAVLSMDDDVHLRRDEIILGFRAWRESREKIVGFPARYHAWDSNGKQWAYNSNHTCELSMVLTGAAFIHKYYFYAYTYWMPAAIRHKVDEIMNCEDIAMNYLVSHLTKGAPVKATSRWTFRCPGCPETLSADESHFVERHDCLNYFTRIYGYTPLQYTQFRVDSILFKMRIPQNHQKCFRYI